jgi:cell wall-associated NlpC family hydrolase
MATLTAEQIYRVCLDVGFSPDEAVTWTAIALAESGGNTEAHNPDGEDSWGLFQVNVDPEVRDNPWGDLTDPHVNAQAAFEISGGGTNLRPWTVTHARNQGTDHDYRNFMDEARAAAGGAYAGNFAGVSGYDDPLPGGDPAQVVGFGGTGSAVAPPPPDADADGLADVFEMSAGTDPNLPDADADGLTDGFEVARGLDPLAVDTDDDGLSDGYEVRMGTDALAADTDGDAMSDAMELAAGRDPVHGVTAEAIAETGADAALDSDDDGLSDAWEESFGSNPQASDSDQDGLSDSFEAAQSTDPLAPDSDGDGIVDSFATTPGNDPLGVGLPVPPVPPGPPGGPAGGPPDPLEVGYPPPGGVPGVGYPPPGVGYPPPGYPPPGGAGFPAAGPIAPGGQAGPVPDEGGATTQAFVEAALAQTGDTYVFGAEAEAGDVDPDAFDCSELTQWAAAQVGLELPDGSWLQYLELERQGAVIPVEQAIDTPGALLFSFSSEPTAGGGRPSQAHMAISLGNGSTIEARGREYGVGSWEATTDRFEYAAVVPGLAPMPGDATLGPPLAVPGAVPAGPDADADGAPDAFEMSSGTDPQQPDSDGDGLTDGFESLHGLDGLVLDGDADGLSDGYEVRLGLNALVPDSDGDGMTDAFELAGGRDAAHGVSLTGIATAGTAGTVSDADGDGLSDPWESSLGTNPHAADSDRDGLSDALELARGTNPHAPDSDGDGLVDGVDNPDDD